MKHVGVKLLFAVIGAGAILSGFHAIAQSALQPPTTRVTDCTTGGCHSAQTNRKFLHGPNAVQACDACHEHVDPAKHTFQLKREGRQLCEFCHIDKTGSEGPVVHKPFATGDCLGCHDPHGAGNSRMLKKETTPELCTQCHKEVLSGKHSHGPAASDCTACHKPHTSSHPHLLSMDNRSLCLSCHQDVGKIMAAAEHPHDPAKGDCLQCHQPHSSNEAKVLKAAPKDLCISCHETVGKAAASCKRTHSPVNEGKACLNCHVAHGSDNAKQLSSDPITACLECHKAPIVVSKDKTIAGLPELAVESMHRHGPVKNGDCGACHAVHGGERDQLLLANYSRTFYQTFSPEAYELCFKCHDKALVLAQPAKDQTNFRDGARNLHAVHVTSGPPGRSCRACHSIHASKFQAQINEFVPFGQWKLPINFSPTATGGSCAPGCHKAEKYDRGSSATLPSLSSPASGPARPGAKIGSSPTVEPAKPQSPQ